MCLGTVPYHTELGLELDLQALECASQFRHLTLAGLYLFGAGGYFTVQLLSL